MAIPNSIVRPILQRLLTPHLEVTLHRSDPFRSRSGQLRTDNPLLVTTSDATIRNGALVLIRDGEQVRSLDVGVATHAALWYRGADFVLSARLRVPLNLVVRQPVYLKAGTILIAFEGVI